MFKILGENYYIDMDAVDEYVQFTSEVVEKTKFLEIVEEMFKVFEAVYLEIFSNAETITMLMDVYEGLNEQNKTKFIAMVESSSKELDKAIEFASKIEK